MSLEDTTVHPDALELASLLRPLWPTIDRRLAETGVPLCEGDDDPGDDTGDDDDLEELPDGVKTFDRPYVERLRREAAARRTEAREAAAAREAAETKVREFETRDQTDLQKAEADKAEAISRAEAAEQRALRADVAADKGVPAKLAKYLSGTTKKEMEASADELLAELGTGRRTPLDGGAREGDIPREGDMDAAIRAMAGRRR